jgi:hypothetical protein
MSFLAAIPDSNPARAQLRLVVLGQWVRAGLEMARGAGGLVGGAVALWRVLQAVRLAMQLAQRLSEMRGAPTPTLGIVTPEPALGDMVAQDPGFVSNDPPTAACLQHALIEITRTIREALGLAPDQRGRPVAGQAARPMAEPVIPRALGCATPPRGRPPDRPPRRRRCALHPLKTLSTPIAAPAIGRFRLAGG